MADAPSPSPSSTAEEPTPQPDLPENPTPQSNQPDPSQPPATVLPPPPQSSSSSAVSSLASSVPVTVNPGSNPPIVIPPPPSIYPYAMSGGAIVPPTAPSFRPASQTVPLSTPQFSPLPNPTLQTSNFQNPSVQPPGVAAGNVGSIAISVPGVMSYQISGGQPLNHTMRPYPPMPNGYSAMIASHGTMPPPGIPRYPSPYTSMIRPAFPPRPPGSVGVLPALLRPLVPGIRAPLIPPALRPAVVPIVTPAEKPQTTVYVGKIAPTVENDFILSILRICGPVKSWKRAQDPSDGTPRGFGFCEFESAEGVLRALRLLSKFSVDGQELVLNVNQATREYLERYVEKKTENSKKHKEAEAGDDKKEESASAVEKDEPVKISVEDSKKETDIDSGNKENNDSANFGIVNDEDREADREALDKLTSMIDERLKTKPLPPPPTQGGPDVSGSLNLEVRAKSRDGDTDVDILKNDAAEEKNDDDTAGEIKTTSDQDKPETSSPDRSRRHDRSSRDRDRERDKREKERELERYERERERERIRRERERELKIREAEQLYKERVKDWEIREREKEYQRQHEKEREKDRQHQRRKETRDQERDGDEDDDDSRKRRRRLDERKRKRLREKEEDLADRFKEEEEIAEAKRRADEEQHQVHQLQQQQRDELKLLSSQITNETDKDPPAEEMDVESKEKADEHAYDESNCGHGNHTGDAVTQNGNGEESTAVSDGLHIGNAPSRKLGFGLMGSGKRTAVPSVFHEEDDDDAHKDKKMRPLVPIDYSTEELQAVQNSTSGAAPLNLAVGTEMLKHGSGVNPKEERHDGERERSKRPHDRSGQWDRDRNDGDNRTREENREKTHERSREREHGADKVKASNNKKLLDAKQLIDMIPKTKEELFSYEINWSIYDKHKLHERMRPWISKKITEFLGEEEATLVDYIVDSTQNHVKASQMLELLQSILDDEAEMFVLKMWRMLIFEIKKVETGLSLRSKT